MLTIKEQTVFCGECEFLKLDSIELCYTTENDDITKGEKPGLQPYVDRRAVFSRTENGYEGPETGSVMTVNETEIGIRLSVGSARSGLSEYGISLPVNFMGKSHGGGWKKQYLLNSVFRSADGKLMFAYLTNPSGNHLCIAAENRLAGWKTDYSTYSFGHFFEKLNFYSDFDKAYQPHTGTNEISLLFLSVNSYEDCLDRLSEIYGVPFLDVETTGGAVGSKIRLLPHGKTDAVRIVNAYAGVTKMVPFSEELEIEYESDTYLFPIRYENGREIVGGEAEIYGYRNILDTYRKAMTTVSLYRVFHFRDGEFDGNICEHQCWASAGLRFLQKYGSLMNDEEKRRLLNKLNFFLDIATETDEGNATPRVTIFDKPQNNLPAYNVFASDRIQEEAFAVTIFLDAYRYFGEQRYYDYAVRTMDSFLDTYQKPDGKLTRLHGEDYSTVCCLIIPIIDMANFLKEKDPVRSERYRQSAGRLAEFIAKRGLDFPTEGSCTLDPEEKEMEDGSISCSALSLLYYCRNIAFTEEYVRTAKTILDVHEAWVMQSSSCGSKGSTLRWWETCWEGDQNGPALCAGHGWTIWRAEADWLYYRLTGDRRYYIKAYNGFMTNISKIRPDGKTYSIRNIDMIPGGGFCTDAGKTEFLLQGKFPKTNDSGLSRYVWVRANDSILEDLISDEAGNWYPAEQKKGNAE